MLIDYLIHFKHFPKSLCKSKHLTTWRCRRKRECVFSEHSAYLHDRWHRHG